MKATPSLLILGAGQYGQVAREVSLLQGGFSRVDFLDDASPQAIGSLDRLESCEHDYVFVAIGNPQVRQHWVERIRRSDKFTLATLVHPRAVVMPSARIGQGSIIEAGAVVCSNSRVGTACIIMANAVVGHDAAVGDFCQIKCNATVPECSTVPNYAKLDCGAQYMDTVAIEERNALFIANEKVRTGVEPSFF